MMYFDSHAHLSFVEEPETLIVRAKEANVMRMLNICTDLKTLERGLELAKRFPEVQNAGSTTPHDVEKEGETFFSSFEKAAMEKSLVAVGETGLDYHYLHSEKKLQQTFLSRYLDLAQRTKLPVIFHCREAFADLLAITKEELSEDHPAILHCFTGSLEEAKAVLDRGWFLSLSGIVTFKKSAALREVARYVPLEQLLIETDTPYLAPQGRRGKSNEPAFLPETALCIAQEKEISLEELSRATFQNAEKLFPLAK